MTIVTPTKGYYATRDLRQLGFAVKEEYTFNEKFVNVDDSNYRLCFDAKNANLNFVLKGYFEDCTNYRKNIHLIKSWLPEVEKRKNNDLVIHFRAGDRLYYKNEFDFKPSFERYKLAIQKFEFDRLHIVTDMPKWEKVTPKDIKEMKFHCEIPESNRVDPQLSADYFNSFVDGMSQYEPIMEKRSIFEDFNFIRSFDNILFEHGTLGWWAAMTSDASKIGVYGPWRPWKGDSNKNLSKVNLPGWFQWE